MPTAPPFVKHFQWLKRDSYRPMWAKTSRAFLSEHPFCAICGAFAEATDHIVPRARGGTDEWDNLQALCWSCHSRKTRTESNGEG